MASSGLTHAVQSGETQPQNTPLSHRLLPAVLSCGAADDEALQALALNRTKFLAPGMEPYNIFSRIH